MSSLSEAPYSNDLIDSPRTGVNDITLKNFGGASGRTLSCQCRRRYCTDCNKKFHFLSLIQQNDQKIQRWNLMAKWLFKDIQWYLKLLENDMFLCSTVVLRNILKRKNSIRKLIRNNRIEPVHKKIKLFIFESRKHINRNKILFINIYLQFVHLYSVFLLVARSSKY